VSKPTLLLAVQSRLLVGLAKAPNWEQGSRGQRASITAVCLSGAKDGSPALTRGVTTAVASGRWRVA
jgi:hypothetical protein